MNSRNNGGKENGFSYSCQKCEKDVVKKTKKIWILKTLYGKHLLDFRNTWYSNLKILYESKSYFFRVECHPLAESGEIVTRAPCRIKTIRRFAFRKATTARTRAE